MARPKHLRILHLEDDGSDAELVRRALLKKWPECDIRLAENREAFESALKGSTFDLIISDSRVPAFNGTEALAAARRTAPSVPFIFVSGTIGEDAAVESLKQGATDYVLKDSLKRLVPAVQRALDEVESKERRRLTEEALTESESRFRPLVEQSLVGTYLIQGDRFIYVNPAMAETLGYSQEELTSRPLLEFIAPDDRKLVKENVRKRLEGVVSTVHYTLRMLRRNGSIAQVQACGGRIDFQGRPAILGTLLDITEQRQAGERIREQAALLDKAQDAIYVRDMAQRITYWNHAAERIYGWSASEVMGKSAAKLLYRNNTSLLDGIRKTVLEKGEWIGELKQITKDGKEIIVESRRTLLRDDHGKPTSILNINTDVTEKKKLESQFLRAQRMESIGTLAGGIAHDLNNVLAPILMAVQLLKEKNELSATAKKLLDTIEISAQRGGGMVRQVLSFARGSEGTRSVVPIKHLVAEQAKIARETFPKSIIIETSCERGIWSVMGDPTQLYQVLMNLCVNARDAMAHGGKLRITAANLLLDETTAEMNIEAKPGPYVVINVSDTGAGIPPEIIDKIFDPFFTTKELGKGTGLGLSTVMGIVNRHRGFTTVYSEVGRGTQFRIYLPALTEVQSGPEASAHKALPDGKGKLILVVDDEPLICEMTQHILAHAGYRVLTANDGTEGLAIFAEHRTEIAVVITDMTMPFLDGPSTIRALEKMQPGIKILAVSGLSDNGSIALSASNANISFLTKPYTSEVLFGELTKLISG